MTVLIRIAGISLIPTFSTISCAKLAIQSISFGAVTSTWVVQIMLSQEVDFLERGALLVFDRLVLTADESISIEQFRYLPEHGIRFDCTYWRRILS